MVAARSLLDLRLLFVTGKGGVGKSTVSAAIAQLGARLGKRVLVCEADGKGDVASLFESPPASFDGREVAPGITVMSMDTEQALREYLKLSIRVPFSAGMGQLAKALDFVATAAPGVREILTVGKLCYEVRERRFDLVVVDAASAGYVVSQLAAPQAINDLVKVGLIRSQTDWMLDMLSDATCTGLVAVTAPEETPVNETLELVETVRNETTVAIAAIAVNRVLPELFGVHEEETFEALCSIEGELSKRLGGDVGPILEGARLAVMLRRTRAGHLKRLQAGLAGVGLGGVPVVFIPYLFSRMHGLRSTTQLAVALEEELGS